MSVIAAKEAETRVIHKFVKNTLHAKSKDGCAILRNAPGIKETKNTAFVKYYTLFFITLNVVNTNHAEMHQKSFPMAIPPYACICQKTDDVAAFRSPA